MGSSCKTLLSHGVSLPCSNAKQKTTDWSHQEAVDRSTAERGWVGRVLGDISVLARRLLSLALALPEDGWLFVSSESFFLSGAKILDPGTN